MLDDDSTRRVTDSCTEEIEKKEHCMDKRIVNNFVVQMRSSVIQARVHVLNKLVREIRKLENKKGTTEQKQKNQRKAERLKEEVLLIKKLDAGIISKFALLCTENPCDILKKVSLTLEERAKARLAAHKNIALQVSIFRMKYPDWKLKLPPLLVQLGLKYKYKKTSPSTSQVLLENDELMRNIENKINYQENVRTSVLNNFNASGNVDINTNNVTDELPQDRKNLSIKRMMGGDQESSIPINNVLSEEKETKVETNTGMKDWLRKRKSNGIAEVRRFADLLVSNTNSEKSDENAFDSEDESFNPSSTVSDPFFLIGDDSGKSDDDIDSKKQETNNNFEKRNCKGSKNKDIVKVPTLNRKQRRMLERSGIERDAILSQFNSSDPSLPLCVLPTKTKFGGYSEKINYKFINTPEEPEILHSSWAAKRKLRAQEVIVPFQGKKIKFNDDDDDE